MDKLKQLFKLIQETVASFGQDNGSMLAASLAYYTVFAIAPLLVIAVAVAGFVFGDAAVQGEIVGAIEGTVGSEAAVIIERLIRNARESGAGIAATALSSIVLLFGASNLFAQLQRALNIIWGVAPAPDRGIMQVVQQRIIAFGMVLLIGLLLLASLATSTVMAAIGEFLGEWLPGIGLFLPSLEFAVSLLLVALLFALLFRILPDVEAAWRDVLVGGAVTAVLFSIGEFLIGLYLSRGSPASAFGAAGSLVIVLLWIYYSAQIVLLGAEFTQVYANRFGQEIRPSDDAVMVTRITTDDLDTPAPDPELSLPPAAVSALPAAADPPAQSPARIIASGLLGLALGLGLGILSRFWERPRDPVNG